jgi:hypothetical protein
MQQFPLIGPSGSSLDVVSMVLVVGAIFLILKFIKALIKDSK